MEALANSYAYGPETAGKIEAMGQIAVSIANRWMMGWLTESERCYRPVVTSNTWNRNWIWKGTSWGTRQVFGILLDAKYCSCTKSRNPPSHLTTWNLYLPHAALPGHRI